MSWRGAAKWWALRSSDSLGVGGNARRKGGDAEGGGGDDGGSGR